MSSTTLAGLGLGGGLGLSLVWLALALSGRRLVPGYRGLEASLAWTRSRGGRAKTARFAVRFWTATGGAIVALAATRWIVAAAAVFALVWFWPRMFGAGRAAARQIDALEGLTAWTEALRDSIAGSVGLEEAILHSTRAAPPSIKPFVDDLSGQLKVRVSLPQALGQFAEDLADPSADLVVGALILNARLRGPGLVATLSALASSTREELELRRQIEERRKSLRRTAIIILGATGSFAGALAVFSRAYVAPYSSIEGQAVLGLVVAIFGVGLAWIRSAAELRVPQRFLSTEFAPNESGPRS